MLKTNTFVCLKRKQCWAPLWSRNLASRVSVDYNYRFQPNHSTRFGPFLNQQQSRAYCAQPTQLEEKDQLKRPAKKVKDDQKPVIDAKSRALPPIPPPSQAVRTKARALVVNSDGDHSLPDDFFDDTDDEMMYNDAAIENEMAANGVNNSNVGVNNSNVGVNNSNVGATNGSVEVIGEGQQAGENVGDKKFPSIPVRPNMDPKELRELIEKNFPGVTVANDRESAERVLKVLYQYKDYYHGCDTETVGLDVKNESPVGKGRIICASIYAGPGVDFGNGPRLYIDNLDSCEGTIDYFKEYFESEEIYKVWHNYSFDRHILYNHGINAKGFGGDTMVMARLQDSSRMHFRLEALSREFQLTAPKTNMEDLFGAYRKKKDGTDVKGQKKVMPPLDGLQRDPDNVLQWIEYSTLDAEVTWLLREELHSQLEKMEWQPGVSSMWDFYVSQWLPFSELLSDIEREGIKINVAHFKEIFPRAIKDRSESEKSFLNWAEKVSPGCRYMNVMSDQQKRQLLFAPTNNKYRKNEWLEQTKTFDIVTERYKQINRNNFDGPETGGRGDENDDTFEGDTVMGGEYWDGFLPPEEREKGDLPSGETESDDGAEVIMNAEDLGEPITLTDEEQAATELLEKEAAEAKERDGKKGKKAKKEPKEKVKKEKKHTQFEIKGLGLLPVEYTKSGWASTSGVVIEKLAKQGSYLFDCAGVDGKEACAALHQLTKSNAIDTLLTSFIAPLPTMADKNDRLHCSLNINTETGRLSARRPNLQNQPALEKDMYKIRNGFIAEPGNLLIVADYGQLELRLLGHVTACKSMLEAFKTGGDFHSRTAIGMYPEIQAAIKEGKVLLEWDGEKGKNPAPLLKDVYSNERKRAKTLNFSIAYGKTVHGFAKDWGVSIEEAQKSLDGWYADRPEVKDWQARMIAYAEETGYTRTLLGRYRPVKNINSENSFKKAAAERIVINTPLQGGAADVMVAAMLKIRKNQRLKELGWKQLLQIHDELIMEGPADSAPEALQLLVKDMENPLDFPLLVDFVVDAKIGRTWMEAK